MARPNQFNPEAKFSAFTGFAERMPFRFWVILLTLLTIAMRLPMLASRPVWYDEAFSILFSREGPAAMLYGTLTPVGGAAADVHPLLYYSLLWVWMKIFGQSILAVRSLSVVISVALLITLVSLSRTLFDKPVALLSGLLFATSPFQIHYGQEARMYGLLALFLVLATLSLQRAVKMKSHLYTTLFGIFSALAMYSHVLAIFFLVPFVMIQLIQNHSRTNLIRILQGSLVGGVLYIPWLVRLPAQISKVQQSYWIERPGLSSLIQTIIAFNGDLPVREGLLPFMLLVSLLILVFVGLESWLMLRRRERRATAGSLTLSLALIPVLLLFGVSQFRPVYIIRGLLPSAVFYLLLISWLLLRGRKLSSSTLGVCLILVFTGGYLSHYSYSGFPYAPFGKLNAYLRANVEAEAVVLHTNKISMLPAYYDDPSLPHRYLQDPIRSGSDTLAPPTQEVLGLFAESDPISAVAEAENVYLIIFQQELEDYARIGYTHHPALTTLERTYVIQREMLWGDLRLYRLEHTE
jgi:uncharacterized membrane protein